MINIKMTKSTERLNAKHPEIISYKNPEVVSAREDLHRQIAQEVNTLLAGVERNTEKASVAGELEGLRRKVQKPFGTHEDQRGFISEKTQEPVDYALREVFENVSKGETDRNLFFADLSVQMGAQLGNHSLGGLEII